MIVVRSQYKAFEAEQSRWFTAAGKASLDNKP